jgi:hypothetical protein
MAVKIMFVSALDAADELISMLPGVKVDYVWDISIRINKIGSFWVMYENNGFWVKR